MVARSEQAKANVPVIQARYKAAHRESIAADMRAYRARDPWSRARYARHNARVRAIRLELDPGTLTKEDFARLHLLPCVYCGVMPAMGADHVVPLARGGWNALDNLVPACKPCNNRKYAKTLDELERGVPYRHSA